MEIAFLKRYNAIKKLSIRGFELTPQVTRYTHLNNCVMRPSLVMSNNLNIAHWQLTSDHGSLKAVVFQQLAYQTYRLTE